VWSHNLSMDSLSLENKDCMYRTSHAYTCLLEHKHRCMGVYVQFLAKIMLSSDPIVQLLFCAFARLWVKERHILIDRPVLSMCL